MMGYVGLKELGGTGIMVPEIGLGTSQYLGGAEPLRRGIELGAALIDTAEMYQNEEDVGRFVDGLRDKVFLATKVLSSHLRYDQVMRSAEESLRKLDVDCIDLYQIHRPNNDIPIAETMSAMEALVDAGLVKHVGVSNFSTRELREAQEAMTKYPIVSNQVAYNLNERGIERDLLPYCQQNRVTVIAYSPLAIGSLASSSWFRRDQAAQSLKQVAKQVGKSVAQVALNWCISQRNVIAIPKSSNLKRIEENCGASGWRLSADQLNVLDKAFAK
jgi:diketogulonate reductase-like aldo/keto reductase